jgi:hypothetical protein
MKKSNHQGRVLKDHQKVGKKFIPPIMQINNMKETSFVEERLPCMIWMAALYNRAGDKLATKVIVDFIESVYKCCKDQKVAPLQYMGSYISLNDVQKNNIYNSFKKKPYYDMLLSNLEHKRLPIRFSLSEPSVWC